LPAGPPAPPQSPSGNSRRSATPRTRETACADRRDRRPPPAQRQSPSVRLAVLPGEAALAVAATGQEEVDVGIGHLVVQGAVADLEVDGPLLAFVAHMVAVALGGGKAGGHPRLQLLFPGVGDERQFALQQVDELVLVAVPVPL